MTREEAINLLKQVNHILVNNNSWTENMHEPLNIAFGMAIKALEQEPCEDAISRADVKKYLSAPDANGDRVIYEDDLDLLPSVAPVHKKSEWISCKERMPEPQENGDKDFSDWLQITIKIGHSVPEDAYVTEGYYCFSEKKWYTKRFVIGEVTAWQSLPEPYKAGI